MSASTEATFQAGGQANQTGGVMTGPGGCANRVLSHAVVPTAGAPCGDAAPLELDIFCDPPKMNRSFELYEVQLRLYLKPLGCWGVVDGSFRSDPHAVNDFETKDNVARGAILYGVPTTEAKRICREKTAEAMWKCFVDMQTTRDYLAYIRTKRKLYTNQYTRDKGMRQWIEEMEMLRLQLRHFGNPVSDEDFAEVLLCNVLTTYREVVRGFSKPYVARGESVRPTPTVDQVIGALLFEAAFDEGVANAQQPKPKKKHNHGKMQRDKGRYKAKQERQYQVKRPDTRSCHVCGEVGHLKANCPNR